MQTSKVNKMYFSIRRAVKAILSICFDNRVVWQICQSAHGSRNGQSWPQSKYDFRQIGSSEFFVLLLAHHIFWGHCRFTDWRLLQAINVSFCRQNRLVCVRCRKTVFQCWHNLICDHVILTFIEQILVMQPLMRLSYTGDKYWIAVRVDVLL